MRASHNRITVRNEDDNIVITSNDENVQQVFFGWADDGKHFALYGGDVPGNAHNRTWKWVLTKALCEELIANIAVNTPESDEEEAANSTVTKVLTAHLKGETLELDEFTRAYLTAAFWTGDSTYFDEETQQMEHTETPLEELYTVEDIHPDCLKKVQEDCAKFQSENQEDLALAYSLYRTRDGYTGAALAGHDFWLTRNGHGTGFWDRDDLEDSGVGDRLAEACKKYNEVNASDDAAIGVVYIE